MTDSEHSPATKTAVIKPNYLRACGLSCVLAIIIAAVLAVFIFGLINKNPVFHKTFSNAKLVVECQLNLSNEGSRSVSKAIERYVRRNGKYPERLEDLYPVFLDDKDILHCPADLSAGDSISYEYYKPEMDAIPSTVIVRCRHHIMGDDQPSWEIALLKDGKVAKTILNAPNAKVIEKLQNR